MTPMPAAQHPRDGLVYCWSGYIKHRAVKRSAFALWVLLSSPPSNPDRRTASHHAGRLVDHCTSRPFPAMHLEDPCMAPTLPAGAEHFSYSSLPSSFFPLRSALCPLVQFNCKFTAWQRLALVSVILLMPVTISTPSVCNTKTE